MNREDYRQVKEIFQSVLDVAPDKRAPYLDEKCSNNAALRREVERLLDSFESGYLEQPAIGELAELIVGSQITVGQGIRHYKIREKIGAGGMGEVFLAEDTRLKRKIALKILPAALSRDKQCLRRFEQEACAASALNHPNILTVHEFGSENGTNFIISEFVKGETLRERLGDGEPIHLPETLDIALQVAAALHAAHESGIVHRDIKPENVMIRADGLVKVLDFGLAKLTLNKNEAIDVADETIINTAPGIVMGTVAYMSPEQARGKETDSRSDIWSLGVVIYEMQTGKPPFTGETTSDKIASILMREPTPFDENMPAELNRILRKALQKNRDERYQTVKDFLLDLKTFKHELEVVPLSFADNGKAFKETTRRKAVAPEDATSVQLEIPTIENRSSFNTAPIIRARWWRSNRILITACAVLLIALMSVIAVWKIINQNRNQASSNILASLRIKSLISWDGEAGEGDSGARFSPSGTMIAYSLTKNGQRNIWTKQISDGKPNPITDGKWNYYNPIWSPDGQRIAFVSNRNNQTAIWAMPFSGGELTPIKALESDINLLRWSKNGATIYYRERFNLFALNIASKQITQLTNFDEINQAQFFNISPSEDRVAYSAGPNERLHIFVMTLSGGQPVQITNDEASDEYPVWLPDGNRIIYSSKRDGIFQTCIAYLNEHKTEQINLGISDTLISDVAPDGGKILFQQSREESDLWQVRIDDKSETRITSDSGLELWSDTSPDGKSVVFQATTESKHLLEGSLLICSIDDKQQIKIASNGFSPTFSPDGRQVAFLRDADNLINLWITDRNGADERQLTTEGIWFDGFSVVPYNRIQVKDYSWSPDGKSLIYCAKKSGLWNIWQIFADGASAPHPMTANTDANVRFSCPLFAPDGKSITYLSNSVTPSSDAKTNAYLLNSEFSEIFFSSESIFKLIGWERFGNNLIIAMPEDKPTAQPIKVRLIRLSTENNRTDLASIEAAYFDNIQLSPDGQKIAYAGHEDEKDNIRVISMASGENAKITANVDSNVYLSGIAWSPDGKTIYYSKQKQAGTISMIENFK